MALDDPISMEDFENAVHAWFSAAIDCPAIWSEQSAPRPDYPYGSLNITSGPLPVSPAWERHTDTDLTRAAGKEVRFQIRVPCTFVVSCQAFVKMPDGRDPTASARTLVTRAQARLYLLTVQEAFREANISVQGSGPVQNISSVINDGNVSRAAIDATFNASLSLDEYTGYIDKTAIESTQLGVDQEFGNV